MVDTEHTPLADADADADASSAPAPARGARDTARRTRRRRFVGGIAIAVAILVAIPGWSLGRVLLADNTDPLGVRVVEWARDHHLAGVVDGIEHYWYTHHAPRRGGTPKGGIPPAPPPAASLAKGARSSGTASKVRAPANIAPFVSTPLSGEGVWKPVGREVGKVPIAWVTYLRPDAVHTSELVGVVHFDMRHLTATLHAGSDVPGGGPWQHGGRIAPADYPRVVAAFNSGFKLKGSRGGYYAEGRTIAPLVGDRASFVTYRDGHADIALWGRDATMTPGVTSVRQNLVLLVDHGQLAADLTSDARWGATVGSRTYVWRSAVCVDGHGDLVYAAGPGLNVSTLAQVMQRAGCVRAMELDINSWWVTLMTFTDDGHGGVTPWKLLPSMVRKNNRYLVDGTRDFFELDAR